MRRFTTIKNLSETRRLPRLGKIRLGVRVQKPDTDKTYPRETDYFVVPPEVAKVYGEKPKAIDVLLPVNDPAIVFPQAYEYYGSSRGLKCTGDGETALRYDDDKKAMVERQCPCEFLDKGCKQRAHLSVILPKVNMGGVYQVDTSSFNSIIDVNSSLDYVQSLIGRFAMVPLLLIREARETHHDGKKQTHYTLRLHFDGTADNVNTLIENSTRVLESCARLAIQPPTQDNPAEDDEATTVIDGEGAAVENTGAEPPPADNQISEQSLLLSLNRLDITVDDVNLVIDLARSLPDEAARKRVNKAAKMRVSEITATKRAAGQ